MPHDGDEGLDLVKEIRRLQRRSRDWTPPKRLHGKIFRILDEVLDDDRLDEDGRPVVSVRDKVRALQPLATFNGQAISANTAVIQALLKKESNDARRRQLEALQPDRGVNVDSLAPDDLGLFAELHDRVSRGESLTGEDAEVYASLMARAASSGEPG